MVFLLALIFLLLPLQAMADSINGSADFTASKYSVKTTAAAGQTTKTEADSFSQRYNLMLEKMIYPKLRLNSAGIFQKDTSNVKSGDEEIHSTNTRFSPHVTLTLLDPIYSAGVGYYLREQEQASSQSFTTTTIGEDYSANLGWKPVGLPTLDLKYMKTNRYDKNRTVQDQTQDSFSLMSQYAFKGIDLRYFGSSATTKDLLHNRETQDMNHNGMASYYGSFFQGRANFGTSYNIVRNEIKVTSTGTGGAPISTQQFPISGLSLITDTHTLTPLDLNPVLIDGNLTVASGLNIGLPAPAADSRARNMGLDSQVVTEVNNLLIWVDREVPANIASTFSWDIYTSPDNLNWTLLSTVFPAPFGPFQNYFEIDFPNVRTRYIKAVVKPLQPTVIGAPGFPSIFITEVQAFVKQSASPSGQSESKFTSGIQTSNTYLRYRLLDSPGLYYDFSYYHTRKDPTDQTFSTLANGLSASHRFSDIFFGTARVAREENSEQELKRSANVYGATLTATPLRTLTHSLVVSARNENGQEGSRDNLSLFMNNTAQLYKGIDLNINGGWISAKDPDGTQLRTTLLSLGANIVPHKTMALNLYLTDSQTGQSRPDGTETAKATRMADLNMTYNPFQTLYLSAALQIVEETDQKTKVLQTYGGTWSPFPDGALQFRVSYTENKSVQEQTKYRIISSGLRYKISSRSFLDFSYQDTLSEAASLTTESQGFTGNLKIFY
jgi:hypothetical protein